MKPQWTCRCCGAEVADNMGDWSTHERRCENQTFRSGSLQRAVRTWVGSEIPEGAKKILRDRFNSLLENK